MHILELRGWKKLLLSDMELKEVINVVDGVIIGFIVDLEIEPNSGQIFSIFVQQRAGLGNLFSKRECIRIPWDQIIKIGENVIIVNYPVKNLG